MKNRYYLVVVFAVCTVWSEAESQDFEDTEELDRCISPLRAIGENGEFAMAHTKQGLDRLCLDVKQALRCFDSYMLSLGESGKEFNRLYHGTRVLLNKVCDPGPYQEEFLTHAPCLGEDNDGYKYCLQICEKKNEKMSPESYSDPQTSYCSLRETLDCLNRVALENCGKQTAKFFEDYMNQKTSGLTSFIQEKRGNFDQCPDSSASHYTPPFP